MTNSKKPNKQEVVVFAEEDYLAIGEISNELLRCRTRNDLNRCIKNLILPLFSAQFCIYAWAEKEICSPFRVIDGQVLDAVGLVKKEIDLLPELYSYNIAMPQKVYASARPVIAYDVDIPRSALNKELDAFFGDHPEYKRSDYLIGAKNSGYMAAVAKFDRNLTLTVTRCDPNPFTLRDVRVMELIRPILLQTIRCIVLSEALAEHRSLVGWLSNVPTGMALINHKAQIIFANRAFRDALSLSPGAYLPKNLADNLMERIAQYAGATVSPYGEPPEPSTGLEPCFYRTSVRRVFRMELDRVNNPCDKKGDPVFLLGLKPANDCFSKLTEKMKEGGLSSREKEICCLVRDGFSDAEIASRLFISLHTVRTHMKTIHQKLDVQSRARLVALLNQTG